MKNHVFVLAVSLVQCLMAALYFTVLLLSVLKSTTDASFIAFIAVQLIASLASSFMLSGYAAWLSFERRSVSSGKGEL